MKEFFINMRNKFDILTAILIMIFISIVVIFIYGKVEEPNYAPTITTGTVTVSSKYINLEVIEVSNNYILYRDKITDNMYLEMTGDAKHGTSYHTMTAIYDKDGKIMKYSDYAD